jgi:hypothetical protein
LVGAPRRTHAKEMHMKRIAATALLACAALPLALLGACATSDSFSQLTGQRWSRTDINTFDVIIISVDGTSYIERPGAPVRVDPGVREIVVQGPATAGFRFGEQRTLKLDVQPCTRYFLEAKKGNSLSQDFEPRVNFTEAIGGCGVKKQG